MEVYKAIAKVSAALASQGIGKNQENTNQNFKFRGIDDILNALARLLAENSLVIIPRVISSQRNEKVTDKSFTDDRGNFIKKESVLFYVSVKVEFDIISAKDGSKHTAAIEGEAMDSGDKATNKAMSAAYKYMAILTFCIPTEGENDPDFHSYEVAPKTLAKPTAIKPAKIAASNEPPAGWKPAYR